MIFINKLKKPAPVAAPTTKVCPYCKSEIHIDAVKFTLRIRPRGHERGFAGCSSHSIYAYKEAS
ncbi:MAG: hypothetical protein ACLS2X_05280 [Coprococcus sp.]